MIFEYVTPDQPTEADGGIVPTHWGTTNVIRSNAMPTVGKSNAQVYARNLITWLSMTWELDLTDAQRIGWGTYAYNSPLTNSWGAPRFINGYAHFLRSNRPRAQQGLPLCIDPPPAFGLATYNAPRMWTQPASNLLYLGINPGDVWAGNTGGYLMLWYSGPASPTRLRPIEKYKPLATFAGSNAGLPSLLTLALPADWVRRPQFQWVRSSATNPGGALSETSAT